MTKTTIDLHRPFMTDIQELRRRAREHMEMGPAVIPQIGKP